MQVLKHYDYSGLVVRLYEYQICDNDSFSYAVVASVFDAGDFYGAAFTFDNCAAAVAKFSELCNSDVVLPGSCK